MLQRNTKYALLTVDLRGLGVQLGGHAGGGVEELVHEGVAAPAGQPSLHLAAAAARPRRTHRQPGVCNNGKVTANYYLLICQRRL